jgi:hypothetical protein
MSVLTWAIFLSVVISYSILLVIKILYNRGSTVNFFALNLISGNGRTIVKAQPKINHTISEYNMACRHAPSKTFDVTLLEAKKPKDFDKQLRERQTIKIPSYSTKWYLLSNYKGVKTSHCIDYSHHINPTIINVKS